MNQIELTIVKFETNDKHWFIHIGKECIGILSNPHIIEMLNEHNARSEEE